MKIYMSGLKVGVIALAALLVSSSAFAAASQANVIKMSGPAEFRKAGDSGWNKLDPGMILSEGDAVKTAKNSEVIMELKGAAKTAEIVVRPASEFVFKTFQHNEAAIDTTLLDVSLGAVLVKAEKLVGESRFEVKTPTSIVGIRGTTFEVSVAK